MTAAYHPLDREPRSRHHYRRAPPRAALIARFRPDDAARRVLHTERTHSGLVHVVTKGQ